MIAPTLPRVRSRGRPLPSDVAGTRPAMQTDFAPTDPASTSPAPASRRDPLIDGFDRRIEYLRLSVTDRCNFRCAYCIGDKPVFLPKREILSLDEIDRLASVFVRCGVRRLRLTGGEPLARRGIVDLARSLSRHLASGDLDEITVTTNGSLLADKAEALYDAGIRRINLSLDTLDPEVFAGVCHNGRLADVLDGLGAARRAGLAVRLNTVVMAGINDRAIEEIMLFAHARGIGLALIETMPIGRVGTDRPNRYVPLARVRDDLERRWTLVDLPDRTLGPARWARVEETEGRIGFITPMSHGFCESCNRVRLTCDGRLTLCLGRDGSIDLKSILRSSESDEPLVAAIAEAVARKPRRHGFDTTRADLGAVSRPMYGTGG